MRLDLLDPSIDVVFKLLLLESRQLLRDMVESVLGLPNAIRDQLVLNPEVPRAVSPYDDFALDVWVRLHDDRKLVLRIQAAAPHRISRAYLARWTRDFIASRGCAQPRPLLEPRLSILWSRGNLSRSLRFHSVLKLTEDHAKELFGPELEFHVLNLAKVPTAREEPNSRILRWARLLNVRSMGELDVLAGEDVVMAEAKAALVRLSADPETQRLARTRIVTRRVDSVR